MTRWHLVRDGFDVLWQDVRYATRRLRASRGFTTVAVLTLALGIGANAAVFSLVNGVLLRSTVLEDPDRLVSITGTERGRSSAFLGLTRDEFDAVADLHLAAIQTMFTSDPLVAALTAGGRTQVASGELVSGDYFRALGLSPRLGRLLGPDDDRDAGDGTPIVLSERVWREWLGGRPDIIGTTVRLAGQPLVVVGVVPDAFNGTWLPTILSTDCWVPRSAADRLRTVQGASSAGPHRTFARLEPEKRVADIRPAVIAIGQRLHAADPRRGLTVIEGMRAIMLDDFVTPGLAVGTAFVSLSALVFLIACANLTNLLLARGATRASELAMRIAIGASRARIFRLVGIEAVVLTMLSALGGLIVTVLATRLMTAVPLPVLEGTRIRFDPSPDWRVFGYALVVAAVAALAVGLLPAWRASRTQPMGIIGSTGLLGAESRRHRRLRFLLVAAQVAVSVVLLLLAGLYVRSAVAASGFDPGYDTTHGAVANIDLAVARFDETRTRDVEPRLLAAAREMPGVDRAVLVSGLGAAGSRAIGTLLTEGQTPGPNGRGSIAQYSSVSPGFFAALHVSLLRGRDFSDADVAASPRVAIVSPELAAECWPGRDPLGQRFRLSADQPLIEVVGVAAAIATGLRQPFPFIYLPLAQDQPRRLSLIVTTRDNPRALIEPLRRLVWRVDPSLPIDDVKTTAESLDVYMAPLRIAALVFGTLGVLGLVIAVLGLYGVMSYFVSRRTREFGIRRALGATRLNIHLVVLRSGLGMLLLGVGTGLPMAFLGSILLEHYLYGVSPHDAATFVAVPVALVCVGMAAASLAARRAARVEPSVALRNL
jgi:putative ABC transport system permease protein